MRKLNLLFKQLEVDLIQSQGIRSDILISKLNNYRPRISTLRNYPELDYPMTYGTITGRLMLKQHIKALKSLNCCVGVSEAVTSNAKRKYGLNNMVIIHNGVETGYFYRVSAWKKWELRKKLNLPEKAVLWITTGHLTERKNPTFLIKVWQNFSIAKSNQHLVFIGDGNLSNLCRDAAGAAKNITFVGRTKDVASYLQAADFYLSASRAEGFPNAVLEAMACGLPALLSDIEPHQEIKSYNSEGVRLFRCDNEADLVDRIKDMLAADYELYADGASGAVEKHFSARIMAANYGDLYLKLSRDFVRD